MGKKSNSGLAFGCNPGHKVNTISKKDRRARPSRRKGHCGKRTKAVRDIIRSLVGFAPYEKRMIEIMRGSMDAKSAKKAYRFAKVRLGTHKRALRKRAEIEEFVRVEA